MKGNVRVNSTGTSICTIAHLCKLLAPTGCTWERWCGNEVRQYTMLRAHRRNCVSITSETQRIAAYCGAD